MNWQESFLPCPPTSWQGLFITKLFKNWRILIFNLQVGSCMYERTPVTWSQITPIKTHTYTGLQTIPTLLRHFTLANFLLPFDNFCRNPTRSQPAGYKNWPTGTFKINLQHMLFPLKVLSTNIKCFNSNSISLHSKHHLWFHKINHHLV